MKNFKKILTGGVLAMALVAGSDLSAMKEIISLDKVKNENKPNYVKIQKIYDEELEAFHFANRPHKEINRSIIDKIVQTTVNKIKKINVKDNCKKIFLGLKVVANFVNNKAIQPAINKIKTINVKNNYQIALQGLKKGAKFVNDKAIQPAINKIKDTQDKRKKAVEYTANCLQIVSGLIGAKTMYHYSCTKQGQNGPTEFIGGNAIIALCTYAWINNAIRPAKKFLLDNIN